MNDDEEFDFDEDLALYEDEITCPYCGHVHSDSWEYPDNSEMNCENCEKEFDYERIVTIEYSSYRKKGGNEE